MAQVDSTGGSGSTGEFYILNWSPAPGSDGPQLNEVILQYDYNIKDEQPFQKFNLSWEIGEQMLIDGVTHLRSDVGEAVFSRITIETITFVAKVYSEGEYQGEVTITYPNIIPRSGGESGWYMVGGAKWSELFSELDSASARRIFSNGFELKDAQIKLINFGPTDLTEALHPAKDTATNERSTPPSNRRPPPADRIPFIESAIGQIVMDYPVSKKSKYTGLPWYYGLHVEGSFKRFPIIVNSTSQIVGPSSTSIETKSYNETAGGYFVGASFHGYPFFGQYFGAGLVLSGSYGGVPRLFSHYDFDFTFREYLGGKEIKLMIEVGRSYRFGAYKDIFIKDLADTHTNTDIRGDIDIRANRIGLGPRIWLGNQTMHNIDILVTMDQLIFPEGVQKWAFGWKFEFWRPGGFRAGVEFSSVYPAAGEVRFARSSDFKTKGTYLRVSLAKSFDKFSRPMLLQRFRSTKWK
jgi:hypothetical protein